MCNKNGPVKSLLLPHVMILTWFNFPWRRYLRNRTRLLNGADFHLEISVSVSISLEISNLLSPDFRTKKFIFYWINLKMRVGILDFKWFHQNQYWFPWAGLQIITFQGWWIFMVKFHEISWNFPAGFTRGISKYRLQIIIFMNWHTNLRGWGCSKNSPTITIQHISSQ